MKTIAQLSGVEFLRQCNKIRHGVDEVLKNTNVMEIRRRTPDYKDDDTAEERKAKYDEQAKKNINDILDVMLEEKPEETIKLFNLLIVLDKDEKEPTGLEMLMTGMEIISDKRVMDFLLSLMRLGDQVTAA